MRGRYYCDLGKFDEGDAKLDRNQTERVQHVSDRVKEHAKDQIDNRRGQNACYWIERKWSDQI